MSKVKLVLEVVEDLRSLADSIIALVDAAEEREETPKVEKKEKEPPKKKEPAPKAKPPTLEEVRAVLVSLVQTGKQPEVKELITAFGADKLSDVPIAAYPEILKQAEAL